MPNGLFVPVSWTCPACNHFIERVSHIGCGGTVVRDPDADVVCTVCGPFLLKELPCPECGYRNRIRFAWLKAFAAGFARGLSRPRR